MSYWWLSTLVSYTILFHIVHAIPAPTSPSTVTFACNKDGNINSISGIDKKHLKVVNHATYCDLKNIDDVQDCAGQKVATMDIVYVMENNSKIQGGQSFGFHLECLYGAYTGVGHLVLSKLTPDPALPVTYSPAFGNVVVDPEMKLTDDSNKDLGADPTLKIGQHVKLQMTTVTSKQHILSPIACFALKPGAGDKDEDKNVTIWTHCDASKSDTAIIPASAWTPGINQSTVSIDMYVFRFAQSSSVNIDCVAQICPIANTTGCELNCSGARRRRRELEREFREVIMTERSSVAFNVISDVENTNSAIGLSFSPCLTSSVVLILWATLKKVF